MRRPPLPQMLLAAALLFAASCAKTSGPRESGPTHYAENGTFTMALTGDAGRFDPYRSQLIFSTAYLAYDPLVHEQPDGKFVSGLAEKWTADATSATFTLRPGVTCSDGTPLTASQVAAALAYVTDPKNKSPQYGVNTPTVGVTATGDDASRTVKVTLKKPFGFLLNTVGQLPIMCRKGLDDPTLLGTTSTGTGPFVLTGSVPGQSYTFTVRKGYSWGPGGARTDVPGTPSRVILKVIENETTAANLLLSGQLNFARITGGDQQRLDAQGLRRLDIPMSGAWLWFNHLKGHPTADVRVRRALVQALDLGAVAKVNTGGKGKAATGLAVMEPRPCRTDTVAGMLPRYDVSAAESLLNQAGWAKGADGMRSKGGERLTLDLHYIAYGSIFDRPTAELMAQKWRAIGVDVKLHGDSRTQFSQTLFTTGDYDVYQQGFGYNLPSQMVPYVSGPKPPDGVNVADIDNPDYATSAGVAASQVAPAACASWARAEQALYRNVDIAPIADRPMNYYLKNAQAQSTGLSIPLPTSIRILK